MWAIETIHYENIGLKGEVQVNDQEITAFPKPYVGYLVNEDKNNGITIIARSDEAVEYPYIFLSKQHAYRSRVLLTHKQGNTKWHCHV